MTEKSGHNTVDNRDIYQLLKQFPADTQEQTQEVWNLSAGASPSRPHVTENDVENALASVHERIGINNSSPNSQTGYSNWRWILAAAVIFLVFGLGFLLLPKTITAPNGKVVSVVLPDGSTAELNSGSQIRYNHLFSFTNRSLHLNGEAFFSVRKSNQPFMVNTGNVTVKVTGTEFNVRSWTNDPLNETEVTVSEGAVLFYPSDQPQKAVNVPSGRLSRWVPQMNEPSTPETVKTDRILAWRENSLMFNNKTLSAIFSELERKFDLSIHVEDPDIEWETLTIYYAEPGSAESVISDICRVKGLRFAETANGFRVYR